MADDVDGDLGALFGRVPSLADSPRSVQRLHGGLTNRNYKVSTPAGTFVARVFSHGAELLAVNRDHEYRNTAAAAAAGAAAPVIEYRPEAGVLVLGYIEGRTFTNADVSAPGNIARVAQACRRLHGAQPFGNDFNMFDIQRRYLALVLARRFRLPAGYAGLMSCFDAMRRALAAHGGDRLGRRRRAGAGRMDHRGRARDRPVRRRHPAVRRVPRQQPVAARPGKRGTRPALRRALAESRA
jgi:Phosphotransferase enzyme family